MIRTPALCRLCRRPIPRGVVKCPYCGARASWRDRARRPAVRAPRRPWRAVGYTILLAVVLVVAFVAFSVVRDLKRPISSLGEPTTSAERPSPAECAELMAQVARQSASDQRATPEVRTRLRQCFEKR